MKTSNKIIASVFAALLLAPSVNALKAGAAVRYDELDNLFQATLNGILGYENVEEASISAEKEILYDIRSLFKSVRDYRIGSRYNRIIKRSDGQSRKTSGSHRNGA